MRAVLIKISTQEIIKKSKYPRADMGEVIGLESDLKWLLVYNPDPPTYDPLIERLEVSNEITETPHPDYKHLDRYERFYNVVTLTSDELDDLEDIEAQGKTQDHINEGGVLFAKCYGKIWRRIHKDRDSNNKLTRPQARSLMEWLQPTYLWLKAGNFHQAKKEINKNNLQTLITDLNITGVTNTFDWFKSKIEDYFTNKYDL